MSIPADHLQSLILIAGISGAGRSTVLTTLSDLGFATVDNLPVPLFPTFIELGQSASWRFTHTALIVDVDTDEHLENLLSDHARLEPPPKRCELVFVDCDTAKILKRYSETRRPHPGFDPNRDKTLADAIQRERELLEPFRHKANLVIDTSELTVHDLKRQVRNFVERVAPEKRPIVRVNFMSFGFRYGVPRDCDLVVDVRFLPNPHFDPDLRPKTGREPEVAKFVLDSPIAQEFVKRYSNLLEFLLPHYVFEGKSYINIGIGCTGGKHRSVALAEHFATIVPDSDYLISVKHRDADR